VRWKGLLLELLWERRTVRAQRGVLGNTVAWRTVGLTLRAAAPRLSSCLCWHQLAQVLCTAMRYRCACRWQSACGNCGTPEQVFMDRSYCSHTHHAPHSLLRPLHKRDKQPQYAGWICYAEKTHGDVLPHLSNAKSPQATAGTLVKRLFCAQHHLDPASVYHVSIMPCYDKKLEAVRPDLTMRTHGAKALGRQSPSYVDGGVLRADVSETDCVLATTEVHELLVKRGETLRSQPMAELDCWLEGWGSGGMLRGVRGGSGGFLEHTLRFATRQLFGVVRTLPHATLGFCPYPAGSAWPGVCGPSCEGGNV
jgi:hypothetical protein